MTNLRLFAGTANPVLAQKISDYLGIPLGKREITHFPDGELRIKLNEDVRGRDIYLIQSTSNPVNEHIMEMLVFVDCARRASAKRITVVIPYFGYARQDRKDEGRVPITAKLMANLIVEAGADRVLTMDLHAAQIQGFFDIPVDNLCAEPVLSGYYGEMKIENLVLVSPDVGNVKRARAYAERLGGDLAIINKRRIDGESVEMGCLIGEVRGKNVLMIDDMISTAGTICDAASLCCDQGAQSVRVGATHAVLCGPAIERLSKSPIEEIVVTDTVPVSAEKQERIGKIKVLSVADLMGEAIHRIHNDQSVSSLFR